MVKKILPLLFLVLGVVLWVGRVYALHTVSGLPVSSPTLGDIWTKTTSDGRVIEWVEVLAPPFVDLTFRYCNAQSCGNQENLECVGNKYIPQFADNLPQKLTIPSLSGSHPEKIFIKAGPAPGFIATGGYFDANDTNSWNEYILSGAPQIGADGGVTINFGTGIKTALGKALAALPRQGDQVCGLTEEEYQGFRNSFGDRFDNSYRQYYKIAIVWSKPSSCCSATQEIELDGRKRTDIVGWRNQSKPELRVYTQQKGDWADRQVGGTDFAKSGTVPTAVASTLSAFGGGLTPDKVGLELMERGVWKPGEGSDWGRLGEYLRSKVSGVEEVNAFTLRDRAGTGDIFLVAYDERRGSKVVSKTIVITDYDPSRKEFQAIDPTRGERNLSFDKLLLGNPWIYRVSNGK